MARRPSTTSVSGLLFVGGANDTALPIVASSVDSHLVVSLLIFLLSTTTVYYLKGAAAGGICCSITHGALTPVDVVKVRSCTAMISRVLYDILKEWLEEQILAMLLLLRLVDVLAHVLAFFFAAPQTRVQLDPVKVRNNKTTTG